MPTTLINRTGIGSVTIAAAVTGKAVVLENWSLTTSAGGQITWVGVDGGAPILDLDDVSVSSPHTRRGVLVTTPGSPLSLLVLAGAGDFDGFAKWHYR
jgi:hypothetical protein